MSGIFGIMRKDEAPVDSTWMPKIKEALAAWGPDGSGCFQEGPIALGLLLLHNTPQSLRETGPVQAGNLVITADIRLDNRDELISRLHLNPLEWRDQPDAALLLQAYQRWQTQCVDYLIGDFAFAIWDKRTRTLFCARDHMGCRPFFYYDSPSFFAFASDLRGLLALEAIPQQLNQEAIIAHHMFEYRYFREQTFFKDLHRLPPAHTLTLTDGQNKRQQYWTIAPRPELRLRDQEEYREHLTETLQEAVSCRLRSAYPIGSHLSGGLDSSAVTVLAARALRAEGRALAGTFSWSPPPQPEEYPLADERALIAAVCEQEGLTCTYTTLTPVEVIAILLRDVSQVPSVHIFAEPATRRQAARAGVRTLLSGWGGDETVAFAGRGYPAELLRRGRWLTLARHVRAHDYPIGFLRHHVFALQLPYPLLRLLGQDIAPAERTVLQEQNWTLTPAERQVLRNKHRVTHARADMRHNQIMMLNNGHLTLRMEAWGIQGVADQIEYRYPLLDKRLVELCLQLPPEQYSRPEWKRYLFRLTMAGILPDEVCWNRSKGEPAKSQASNMVIRAGKEKLKNMITAGEAELAVTSFVHPRELAGTVSQSPASLLDS